MTMGLSRGILPAESALMIGCNAVFYIKISHSGNGGNYMKHLRFELQSTPTIKTKVWFVQSQANAMTLGNVRWYAPWRRYVFHPSGIVGLLFDSSCLKEITEFIDLEMKKRK